MDAGAITLRMSANTATLRADLNDAKAAVTSATADMAKSTDTATEATQKYTLSVKQQREAALAGAAAQAEYMDKLQATAAKAAAANLSQADSLREQARILGMTNVAEPYIAQIEKATASTHSLSLATSGVTRELSVMAGEAMRGDWTRLEGSMTVLANRTGLLQMAFGPLGAVIAGVAAAVGVLAVAFVKGAEETEKLNAALQITGDYSGLIAGDFQGMAASIAQSADVGIGKGKQALMDLISTGRISGAAMGILGQDIVRQSELTGVSLDKTAQDYAKMADGVAKWAEKHNESMHFMSLAQYEYIKAMEDSGDKTGAMIEVGKLLDTHLTTQQQNLGTLQRAWKSLGEEASSVWDKMLGLGRAPTVNSRLQEADAAVAQARLNLSGNFGGTSAENAAALQAALAKQAQAQADVLEAKRQAEHKAEMDRINEEGVKAVDAIHKRLMQYDKVASVQEQLNAAQKEFDAAAAAGHAVSAKDQQTIIDGIEAQIKARKASTAAFNDGVNAEVQTLQARDRLIQEQTKQQVKDIESLYKQGVLSRKDSLDQETATEVAAIEQRKALLAQELEIAAKKEHSQTEQARIRAEMAKLDQDASGIIQDNANKEAEAIQKMWDASGKVYASELDAKQKDIDKINEQAAVLQQEIDTHGKSAIAIQQVTLAREQEQAARMAALGLYGPYLDKLNEEIAAREKLIAAMQSKSLQEANDKAVKKAAEEWKKTSDEINRTLTDALMRAFESGSGFGKAFIKTIEDMFKTMVLRPVIQAEMSNVAQSVTGSAATSATGSYLGMSGSLLGAGASATMQNGLISGFGANMANIGALTEAGSYMTALSAAAPYLVAGLAAVEIISSFTKHGGPKADGSYGYTAGFGSDHGGQLDQAAATTVQGMDASYAQYLAAVGGSSVAGRAPQFGVGYSTDPQGTSPTFVVATLKLADGSTPLYDLNKNVGRDNASLQAAIQDQAARAVLAALQQSNLPAQLQSYLTKLDPMTASSKDIAAAMKITQDVGALWHAVDSLGGPFLDLQHLSVESAAGLIKLAGGLQNLDAELSSFYKNFYSQAEQNAQMAKNISATLVAAGLQYTADQITAMTRDAFRGLVEYEMSLGDAGTTAVAALLSVQQAFADLHPVTAAAAAATAATTTATQSAVTQVQTLAEALDSLKNPIRTVADIAKSIFNMQQQGQSLQVQLLTAQGNTAGAAALQRAIDTAGMTDAELAVYNYNQGIKDQIQALTDAKQAAQDAATATDTAYQALQTAVTAQKSVLQQSITDIQSVFNAVKQGATTLYGQVSSTQQAQAMQGSQFIASALSAAQKTGYLPDPAQLQSAITAAMAGISAQTYATQFEADRARLVLAGQLSQLQDISGHQLSDAQKQLQALDDILTQAKAQIDQLRGINSGVQSVSAALAGLQRAIEAEQASKAAVASSGISHTLSNGVVVSGMSSTDAFFNPYTAKWTGATGPASSAGGVQAQLASMGLALSAAGIVPAYADGTDYVPSTGLAMIHQGERIIPRELNQSSGGGDSLLTRIADRLDRLQAVTERQGQHLETVSSAFKGGQQMPLLVQTV